MGTVVFGRRSDTSVATRARQRRRARHPARLRRPGRSGLARHPQRGSPRRDDRARPRPDAVAAHRPAVGARHRLAPRPVHRLARAWLVLDRAVRRSRLLVDRSAHHHHELRRRADADFRHRAGQCRRRVVLDGARRAEGRARSAGLRAGGELGGADRAARHHRPHHAHRSAARPRAHRSGAAAVDRQPARIRGASRSRRSKCATW